MEFIEREGEQVERVLIRERLIFWIGITALAYYVVHKNIRDWSELPNKIVFKIVGIWFLMIWALVLARYATILMLGAELMLLGWDAYVLFNNKEEIEQNVEKVKILKVPKRKVNRKKLLSNLHSAHANYLEKKNFGSVKNTEIMHKANAGGFSSFIADRKKRLNLTDVESGGGNAEEGEKKTFYFF
mgnify:FL=1